jgi:ribosomal protein S27AE
MIDPRVAYLDPVSQPFLLLVAAFILGLLGYLILFPLCLPALILFVLGIAFWAAERRTPHRDAGPWITKPGAWCPRCGGPAMWMPADARWYCNSCGQYLATDLPPPPA